jgi:chloramphenicol-sensitive protein RarD
MAAAPFHAADDPHPQRDARGVAYAFLAYTCWGFIPIYFKAIRTLPPFEVLCHRVVWALLLLLALTWPSADRRRELRAAWQNPRTRRLLALSTVLIAANWLVYIFAVVSGHVLEGSLGYYITPLLSVVLGVAVLKEHLARPVLVAVLIAAGGVLFLTIAAGRPPWIALALAFSFGLYGLVRKVAPVGAVVGLTIETGILFPLAVAYLVWAAHAHRGAFLSVDRRTDVLLVLAGPVTAVPLLFFAGAARRLRLSTLGFLQYFSPTLQFILALTLFGEPFTFARGVAFACIWVALGLFAAHTVRVSAARR